MNVPGGRTPDQREKNEIEELADIYLSLTRCPGGRMLVEGFVCQWCGHDYTVDDKCPKPDRARQ